MQDTNQDKGGELDREHNTEHERNWNKSRPLRPTSSLHLPPTAERGQIRSLIHADNMSLMSTRTPQRHHSPTGSSRANVPVGSSDDEESVHEGGSNWNASRPKWTHGTPRPVPPFEPQSPGVKESLKTLATRKEESSQRSHTTNEGRIRDGSTAFARAASPTSRFNSSPSPHLPPHDTTQSQKLQLNGTVLQCPPSSSKAKGKGKALDHSLSSGFSFVKKRIPLEPMELETDESGQDEMSQRKDLLSSPTRSSKVSAGISIRSPKKFKPPPKASIRSSSPVSNVKALDTHDTESKPTFLDVLSMANTDRNESSEARNLSQEQTPTIRSTPFPSLETLENPPPRRPSSPLQLSNDKLEQSRIILQRKLGYNHTTISSEPQTQMPHMLQEISPLPSLPLQSPPRNSHVKPASPLLTPPKRPSTSQTEFQTPSPPKNMPDLPGPPTSSEDEAAEEYRAPGHLRSDLTAMKTPRPPGAWTSTPAFQRKTSRPSLSESNAGQEHSNRSQTPDHVHKANSTTTKTSRPPGSWASTPIPFSSREQNLSHSGNPKEEYENGLLTPGVSFSTGPSLYAQTPAPPGAYVVTPARKKGIAKVRFDDVSDSGSVGSMTREPLEDITNASSSKATSCTTLPQVDTPQRADLATPVSPVPRRTKSQTSPGIRVLDAFGREFVRDEAGKAVDKAKNKNGIRIVDALGREVEDIDQPSHLTTTEESVPEPSTPLKHDEALLRVRQGLADLVNDLDEMDKLEKNGQELDYTRLEKLQQTSAETQIARARVSAAISSNAEDIKKKLKSLRASMKESKLFSDRRIHHIIDTLRNQPRARYGENIPLDPAVLPDWCIGRLESWGTTAGMETFKDEGRQGGISVVLGGKVVVVDVDFSLNKTELDRPRIMVSSVKTSYAITASDGTTSNSGGSPSLDEFLRRCIQNFCDEVQKTEDVRKSDEAARLGVIVTQQLQYLVMLDKLAARKDDGGLQWFTGLDKLCPTLEAFAASEAQAVASYAHLSTFQQITFDFVLYTGHYHLSKPLWIFFSCAVMRYHSHS
ncbi:hypothetical protein C0989_011267 [Termitomyces sp. Mn162]|nr:hypothetical protein C0989_011267 [Termitomyces sp. Mn162]